MNENKKGRKKHNLSTVSSEARDGMSLVPEEDEQFESAAAQAYRDSLLEKEEREKLEIRREQEKKRAYEKKLHDEKVAMIKEKQGVSDGEEHQEHQEQLEDDAEPEETKPKTFLKKLENFWYHYKWPVIIGVIAAAFGIYMIAELLSNKKPDIMIIATVDNGLSYRAEQVEKFLAKYCEDLNGDGEVYVQVMFTPMNPDSTGDQMQQSYETKLYANLANAECVLFITDKDSFYSIEQVAYEDLSQRIQSPYVTAEGVSLDSKLIKDGFNWAQLPDDMVIKMRAPVKTLVDEQEDMQESCDKAEEFLEKLVSAMEEYDRLMG